MAWAPVLHPGFSPRPLCHLKALPSSSQHRVGLPCPPAAFRSPALLLGDLKPSWITLPCLPRLLVCRFISPCRPRSPACAGQLPQRGPPQAAEDFTSPLSLPNPPPLLTGVTPSTGASRRRTPATPTAGEPSPAAESHSGDTLSVLSLALSGLVWGESLCTTLSGSAWAAVTKYCRLGGGYNRHSFLTVLELEVQGPGASTARFRWGPSPHADGELLALSSHHGEQTEGTSSLPTPAGH